MDKKIIVAVILLVSIFLVSCTQSPSQNYGGYNQQQGQAQNPNVGGGCGVAPSGNYESVPAKTLNPTDSGL